MDSLLNKAGKKLFEKHLEKYTPADPLYETYTTEKGKTKQRKRALPPGLSKRDARILHKLMFRAHHLDKGFSILGMRFGYTFIVGLIPVVGDFADIGFNYLLILRPAQKLDLPGWLLRRMLLNNIISASVGLVPLVGDVVLASFKANSRNVALVEEFLRIRGEELLKMGGVVEEEEGRGLFGFGKGKGKKAKRNAPPASNKNDVEQVKPGAGMTGPELKDSLADVPPPNVGSKFKSKSKSKSGMASTTAMAPSSEKDVGPSASSSGSSGFSFFNSRSRKSKSPVDASAAAPGTHPPIPTKKDTGRFVEDVAGSPGV
jgi:hypothetical protein